MRQFNFASPKSSSYKEYLKPGALTDLTETVMAGTDRKEYKGMQLETVAKLPTVYGAFNPREQHVFELEDEKIYKTVNNKEVFGRDIKALTLLMYTKPRTAYVEFGREKQVHSTMYSGAVPIPLLGFKRFHNIAYDKWRATFNKAAYLDSKNQELVDGEGALEKAFKIDVYLGSTFTSTTYNVETDKVEWAKAYGLLLLSTLEGKGYKPNAETINYLRTKGMGNHRGSFASAYGTARVTFDEHIKGLDKDVINMYNKASSPLRLLMAQRWAWYGNHRNTDMICDLQNWDELPKKHDTVENAFIGLTPKTGQTSGLAKHFGIGSK